MPRFAPDLLARWAEAVLAKLGVPPEEGRIVADVLVQEGRLPAEQASQAVERCLQRLREHFGMASLALPATHGV